MHVEKNKPEDRILDQKIGDEKTPALPSAVNKEKQNVLEELTQKPLTRAQQRIRDAEDKEYQRLAKFYDDKLIDVTEQFLFKYDGSETDAAFELLDQFDQVWKMIADNHNRKRTTPLHVERNAFISYIGKLKELSKLRPSIKEKLAHENPELELMNGNDAGKAALSPQDADKLANKSQSDYAAEFHDKKNLIFKGFNLLGLLEFMKKPGGHFIDNFTEEQAAELTNEIHKVFSIDLIERIPENKGYLFRILPTKAEVTLDKSGEHA